MATRLGSSARVPSAARYLRFLLCGPAGYNACKLSRRRSCVLLKERGVPQSKFAQLGFVMRASLVVFAVLLTSPLAAQEVGDTVVVTADEVQVLTESGETVSVPQGNHFIITEIDGDRYQGSSQSVRGSFDKDAVSATPVALQFFSEAIRREPQAASNYVNRATIFVTQQDYRQALKDYDRAIELDPESALPYQERGVTYSQLGNLDAAIADFNEAIELDPEPPQPYNNRAVAWAQLGEFDKALADLNKVIEIQPDYAYAYFNRGSVWRDLSEYRAACADYQQCLKLDPKFPRPHNGLAWLYATCPDDDVRNGELAVKHGKEAVRLSAGKNDKYLGTLAAGYAEAGDFRQAIDTLQQAIAQNPTNLVEIRQQMLEQFRAGKPYRDLPEK